MTKDKIAFLEKLLLAVTALGVSMAGWFMVLLYREYQELSKDHFNHKVEAEHRFTKLEANSP